MPFTNFYLYHILDPFWRYGNGTALVKSLSDGKRKLADVRPTKENYHEQPLSSEASGQIENAGKPA
jgi:hypothetical protein